MTNDKPIKDKNLEYLNRYKDQLNRNIEKVDKEKVRLDMRQTQDKKDVVAVELIIIDLEKDDNGS